MDIDRLSFLDLRWRGNMPVEQIIAEPHFSIYKLAELNIHEKLKGSLLSHTARLDAHRRNLIVGHSNGN